MAGVFKEITQKFTSMENDWRTKKILMLNPVFQCEAVKVYIMIIIK